MTANNFGLLVHAAAGLGVVRGRNGGRMVSRSSGDARALDDAYVMVLRRESDGAWRIAQLIWHSQGTARPPR